MKNTLNQLEANVSEQAPPATTGENGVTEYFQSVASYWDTVYRRNDVQGVIYQERLAHVLAVVDQQSLPEGSRTLDLGCGAGLLTVALAKRGYYVEAVDSAAAMLELSRGHAQAEGVGQRVSTTVGDADHLNFPDGEFPLSISIGVFPWLPEPVKALSELARVTKPGGRMVITFDNRDHLDFLLDPLKSPFLSWARHTVRKIFGLAWQYSEWGSTVRSKRHSIKDVDSLLKEAGLTKVHIETIGFGPFTLFERRFLSDWFEVRLHRMLQRLANLKFPWLRHTGSHILVIAVKQH